MGKWRVGGALLWCGLVLGQQPTPGPQVATFHSDVDGSDQPYGLYVPQQYDPSKSYPLVMMLHGAGSNHRLALRRVFGKGNLPGESDAEATRHFPVLRDVDYFVATPYARGTMGYQGIAEKDVYDVLAEVRRRFRIDGERIYLTGLSMGGGGALWLGLTRPDIWAAVAPVCPAPASGTDELAGNALNFPVHLFQGEIDPIVPAAQTRRWQKRLLDAGVKTEYKEYPAVRHNSWDQAYRNGAIFDWFAQFRRDPFPNRVHFATRQYAYSRAYWVRLDQLTSGALATVDARWTGRNALVLETGDTQALTLEVAGHPQFSARTALQVNIDGTKLVSRTAGVVSLQKSAKGWRVVTAPTQLAGKRSGIEGPLREVVAQRHLYVYGTADFPSTEELQHRRDEATKAADWSTPSTKLSLTLRVVADRDVETADLETSNLVLFGTKETNQLIARFAPQLPLALNAGAADFGLVYLAPVGKRLALVNSGLPWWTNAEGARRGGLPFIPQPYRALLSLPEFVLFKGGLDNVVAEGTFGQDWQLTAGDRAKLAATGAVEIR